MRVVIPPGRQWVYSNPGYLTIQKVISDATQRAYSATATELVLAPLEMKDSFIAPSPPSGRSENVASGHVAGRVLSGRFRRYPELTVAGLWSTPSDLSHLLLDLQASATGVSSRLLTPAMSGEMMQPGLGSWGLGVGIIGADASRRFFHTGIAEGYESIFLGYTRRGEGLVIMTNGVGGQQLINEIVRAVATEYGWTDMLPRRVRQETKVRPVPSGFGGYYSAGDDRVWIKAAHGQMLARFGGDDWRPLLPVAGNRYARSDGQPTELELVRQEHGQFVTFHEGTSSRAVPRTTDPVRLIDGTPVYVRGTMNAWDTTLKLRAGARQRWFVDVHLEPGDFEFKLATEDWDRLELGGYFNQVDVPLQQPTVLAPSGQNLWIQIRHKGQYRFTLIASDAMYPVLTVAELIGG